MAAVLLAEGPKMSSLKCKELWTLGDGENRPTGHCSSGTDHLQSGQISLGETPGPKADLQSPAEN